MKLGQWLANHFSVTLQSGPDGATGLAALERQAGENMAWYDTRSTIDAWPVEQPQAGYANDVLRQIDPTWEPR